MKIAAFYDTQYGFTRHCLELLGQALPAGVEWEIHPLEDAPDRNLPAWDAIVVGGPIYRGHFRPRLKSFLTTHQATLAQVGSLHLFAVGLSTRATAFGIVDRELKPLLGQTVSAVWFFGGRLPWPRLGWWDRFTLRLTRGLENEVSNLDLAEIHALAAALSKL